METISLRELKKLRERVAKMEEELKRKEALFAAQDKIEKEKFKVLKNRADDVNIEKAKEQHGKTKESK